MTEKALIAGWLYLPLSILGERRASLLRMQLQFLSPFAQPTVELQADGTARITPPIPMQLYTDSMSGYLGVPRAWGLRHFADWEMEDYRTLGDSIRVAKRPDPNHPRVLNPAAQAMFFEDLIVGLREHTMLTAMAATGSGKTVSALNAAAELGHRTIILVHLNRLLRQWVGEIHDKLGVPKSRIGIAQQNTADWRGKDFVVGLLHSVAQRDYGAEFYNAFGFVINDECHKTSTDFFAPALSKFPAKYRLNLSATPTRKDRGEKVFFMHAGPIRVVSTAAASPIRIYVRDYHTVSKLWGTTNTSRVQCLTKDQDRNIFITRVIRQFYLNDRQALIVSDSVMHLQELMKLAEAHGVPRTLMGQFTGDIHTVVMAKATVDMASRSDTVGPDWVVRTKDGELKLVAKLKKTKQRQEALDKIQNESQFIFATYGMMTEGIDIPRLDAGIDATPRGAATQLIGRLRRPVPGKRLPVWVTVRDVMCKMSMRWFEGRCKDYHATNAEVVYYGTKSIGSNSGTVSGTPGALLGSSTQ